MWKANALPANSNEPALIGVSVNCFIKEIATFPLPINSSIYGGQSFQFAVHAVIRETALLDQIMSADTKHLKIALLTHALFIGMKVMMYSRIIPHKQ